MIFLSLWDDNFTELHTLNYKYSIEFDFRVRDLLLYSRRPIYIWYGYGYGYDTPRIAVPTFQSSSVVLCCADRISRSLTLTHYCAAACLLQNTRITDHGSLRRSLRLWITKYISGSGSGGGVLLQSMSGYWLRLRLRYENDTILLRQRDTKD